MAIPPPAVVQSLPVVDRAEALDHSVLSEAGLLEVAVEDCCSGSDGFLGHPCITGEVSRREYKQAPGAAQEILAGRGSAGDDRQKLHEKDDYPIQC